MDGRIECTHFEFHIDDTNAPHLPDYILDRGIEGPVPQKEFSCFVCVAAGLTGIKFEVRKHVILCGNSREHPGLIALFAGHSDCPVRGGYKNSRMSIEYTKDVATCPDSFQHDLGFELIRCKKY